MGFITTVTTNGMLYPKYATRLKGLVDMLHFSLDAADAETHDALRGVRCFEFVEESVKIALSLGERPDILFTVFNHNIGDIEKVWNDFALRYNLVLILNPVFDYNQVDTGSQLTQENLVLLEQWGKRKNVYVNRGFIALRRDGGNHTEDPVCKAASTTVVISPNNELLLPCYHLGEEALPIEGNLYQLYHSEKVQRLIAMEGRYSACEGCTINCYMQPSFAVEVNRYWWKALGSTLKYNWMKGTWKQLF